ncbi:BnaC09g39600D [Brassica napus]|uniref:BnaC09g39600D protein n=1 Tax=Brassica napus TaxID=3708 RepID=A0A078GG51_BRANA|nr:BnaC09g39600D [Brassica napus]
MLAGTFGNSLRFLHPDISNLLRQGQLDLIDDGTSHIAVQPRLTPFNLEQLLSFSCSFKPVLVRSNSSRLISLPIEEGSSFKRKQSLSLHLLSLVV